MELDEYIEKMADCLKGGNHPPKPNESFTRRYSKTYSLHAEPNELRDKIRKMASDILKDTEDSAHIIKDVHGTYNCVWIDFEHKVTNPDYPAMKAAFDETCSKIAEDRKAHHLKKLLLQREELNKKIEEMQAQEG